MLVIKVAEILGPYKSPPHSRNYSVLALYFLRCISSKTRLCEPRQTEVLHSNCCFKKYLVLQQCSDWCRRIFSHSGFWVLGLLPQSVQTLLLVYSAKGRFFQPLFCHYRTPFCKVVLTYSMRLTSSVSMFLEGLAVSKCSLLTLLEGSLFLLHGLQRIFELRLQTISA